MAYILDYLFLIYSLNDVLYIQQDEIADINSARHFLREYNHLHQKPNRKPMPPPPRHHHAATTATTTLPHMQATNMQADDPILRNSNNVMRMGQTSYSMYNYFIYYVNLNIVFLLSPNYLQFIAIYKNNNEEVSLLFLHILLHDR